MESNSIPLTDIENKLKQVEDALSQVHIGSFYLDTFATHIYSTNVQVRADNNISAYLYGFCSEKLVSAMQKIVDTLAVEYDKVERDLLKCSIRAIYNRIIKQILKTNIRECDVTRTIILKVDSAINKALNDYSEI